jgi:hypothetical protein
MSQNTPHTHTHTHTHTSSKNAPTCGICGEVLQIDPSTGKIETFHAHALRQSTNMSLSEEVRAKERKNKENLEALKEKRDAAKKAKFSRNSKKAKEVQEFKSGGAAAAKPSTAQVILAAIVAAFAAVSSVSYTDADAEEEAREFIARFGYPTNEFAIRGVVKAFNATVGAGGEKKVRLKQQRVQQFMTLSESGFPVNGPPDGERRPGPRKRVKNTPDEDRKIQTIEVYDFNEGKKVNKSGFVYETDFCLGSMVFPEFEDLYYAMIVTAFKCGMPPAMPFSGNEMFFSVEQANDFAQKRDAKMCGVSGIPYVGSWDKHCNRVGTSECLAALEAKKARFAEANTETAKSAAPKKTKQIKQNGNKFAGLVVDNESDSEDEPSTPPVEVERKVSSPKAKHDARKAAQKAKKAATKVVAPAPKVQKKVAAKVVVKAEPTLDEQIAALKAQAATLQAQKDAERKEREAAAAKVAAQQRREAAEKAAKAEREAKERELAELQQMVQELQKSPEKTAKKCRKALKAIGKFEELKSQGKTLSKEQLAKVARKAEFEKDLAEAEFEMDLAEATAPVEKQTDDKWASRYEEPANVAPAPAPASKWVAGAPKLSTGPNRLFTGFGA